MMNIPGINWNVWVYVHWSTVSS